MHVYIYIWTSPVAQLVKNLPVMQETQVQSSGWGDPPEKETAIHYSIFAWRILWTEETGGTVHGVSRVRHDLITSPPPPPPHTHTHTHTHIYNRHTHTYTLLCLFWASLVLSGKEFSCQCKRCRFNPWVRNIPLEKEMESHSGNFCGKSHGQRNLASYSPQGHKSWP